MEQIVEIIFIGLVGYGMLLMALAVIGTKTMLDAMRRNELLDRLKNFSGNPLSEVGISVAVCGDQTIEDIQRRLSMDYVMFEVIWVTDFNRSSSCGEILETYSMVRMPCSKCGCDVYRSRARRYKKLVIMDYPNGDVCSCFNAAVDVASYDYLVALDESTFLFPAALQQFNTKLSDGTAPLSVDVLCAIKTGAVNDSALYELVSAVEMLFFVAGYGSYGGRLGITALFERETLIDAGGFRDRDRWDESALRSIRSQANLSTEGWREVLIPSVVSYSRTTIKPLRRNPLSGVRYLPTYIHAGIYIAMIATGLWVAMSGRDALLIQLLLVGALFLSIQLVSASLAVLLLRHKALPCNRFRSTNSLIVAIFIYPFYRIMYNIRSKNFVK